MLLKVEVRGHFQLPRVWAHPARRWPSPPADGADVRRGLNLYADRPRLPGMPKIGIRALPGDRDRVHLRLATGNHFAATTSSTGPLVLRVVYHLGTARDLYGVTGRLLELAGYRRRALLVGSGKQIEAVAHALGGRARTMVEPRRLHLADPTPPERPALAGQARPAQRGPRSREDRRGDHRRSRLPPGTRAGPGRPLPPARGDRARRPLDDGDPGRPRRVRARRVGPAVHVAPAGVRGHRLRAQAHLRPRPCPRSAWCCSPPCCWPSPSP